MDIIYVAVIFAQKVSNEIDLNNNPNSLLRYDAIGSNVYITWSDDSLGSSHTFFKRSTDNGAHFRGTRDLGPALQITSTTPFALNAQLDAISSNVYVVWEDDNSDIASRASTDNGAHFRGTKNLSNNDGESSVPQIISSGGNIYVVWQDDTQGKSDILFKKGVD